MCFQANICLAGIRIAAPPHDSGRLLNYFKKTSPMTKAKRTAGVSHLGVEIGIVRQRVKHSFNRV
ncbi:MAG: hypothetical protein WBD01_08100 [Salaquimonas sp.]